MYEMTNRQRLSAGDWTTQPRIPALQAGNKQTSRARQASRQDLRVLPALVVHLVLERALLVGGILVSDVKDLGIIQDLMVEAKDFLVLAVQSGRHLGRRKKKEERREERKE